MSAVRALLSMGLLVLSATFAAAQTPVPTTTTTTRTTLSTQSLELKAPLLVRRPTALQLQPRTITNRVLTSAQLAELLRRRLPTLKPAGPPSKQALVVIMENGGIMNNVEPALREQLDVDIRTATCGNFEFELRAGEGIPELLVRIGAQIAGNLHCLNPANWRITTLNPYQVLNQFTDTALENAVKANNSLLNTQSHYEQVVVLEDEDATPSKVIAAIRQLAPAHVIDVHVLTHGTNEQFVGHNNVRFTNSSFFAPLKADKDAGKLYLRSVYQMNCVSGTLKDNWVSLGAVAVNGTEALHLNNMPHQYFHFLERWLNVQGERTASEGSWRDAEVYTRPIYALIGKGDKVNSSLLTTTGATPNATVNTTLASR